MNEYVVIYEHADGSWGGFYRHLPIFGAADSRDEIEKLMKEALEFTLERERDEPGSFLVEPAVAHPGDEAALIRRRPDGMWHAVLDGAPNITAVGDSPDQVAYLIAEAAAAYRELQDDEPALPESEFEAALVRAAAVAPA